MIKELHPCKLCGEMHPAAKLKSGKISPAFCNEKCARKWYYDNVQKPRQAAGLPPAELTQRSGRRPHKRAGKPTSRDYIQNIRRYCGPNGAYLPPKCVTEVS